MRRQILAPVTAGVLLALAGTAQAATKTTTFNVTANVLENCTISAGDLNFGNWSGDVDVAVQSTIVVHCTNATGFEVSLSGGLISGDPLDRQMSSGGAVNLHYNLFTDLNHSDIWGDGTDGSTVLGAGTGMANAINLTVYGQLLASANPGGFDAGLYSDTVTATIEY